MRTRIGIVVVALAASVALGAAACSGEVSSIGKGSLNDETPSPVSIIAGVLVQNANAFAKELDNKVLVAEIVYKAALMRRQQKGSPLDETDKAYVLGLRRSLSDGTLVFGVSVGQLTDTDTEKLKFDASLTLTIDNGIVLKGEAAVEYIKKAKQAGRATTFVYVRSAATNEQQVFLLCDAAKDAGVDGSADASDDGAAQSVSKTSGDLVSKQFMPAADEVSADAEPCTCACPPSNGVRSAAHSVVDCELSPPDDEFWSSVLETVL
jgi:hypothetical protein